MQVRWSKSGKAGGIGVLAKKRNLVGSTEIEKVGDAAGLPYGGIGNMGREDMGKSVRVDGCHGGQRLLSGTSKQNLLCMARVHNVFCLHILRVYGESLLKKSSKVL